ncbi:hypothetical protein RB200_03335 [Streptomyces sp. PmtG]
MLLHGMTGPRVLGALTHGEGPLHVRYDAYAPPGTRAGSPGAVFAPPQDRPLPPVLADDLAARRTRPAADFPYRVQSALRLGCGGGTYLAAAEPAAPGTCTATSTGTGTGTGRTVVLKEARPGAGLDARGDDAATRLAREHRNLTRLADLGCVPAPGPYRTVGGHHFLEREHVEGTNLFAESLRLPLGTSEYARRETPGYTRWALGVLDRLERALDALRARGLRLGELRPHNVVLRPGGDVVLIDLASATALDDDRPPAHGDPGFTVPPGLTAAQAHAYLLNCVRVALLLPVDHGDPVKVPTLVSEIGRHHRVPPGHGERMLTALLPQGRPEKTDTAGELFTETPLDWPRVRDALVRGIHRSATPERADLGCSPEPPPGPGGSAAPPSATAPPESSTPCTRRAPNSPTPIRAGWPRPPARRATRRQGFTTGCTASRTPSTSSATARQRSTCSAGVPPPPGGSAPTCSPGAPASP